MSLLAWVQVGRDTHIVPEKELERHHLRDAFWRSCAPTCQFIEDDPDFPLVVQHISLAKRKWGRPVFEPTE